tara:strand:+ start:604 stop:783 length:180 start_codon:yes stop_codon:yes gene_type:complete
MASRLDGPSDRKKDLDKRYDPKGGGKNPFRPSFPVKTAKSNQNKRVASRVFGDRTTKES